MSPSEPLVNTIAVSAISHLLSDEHTGCINFDIPGCADEFVLGGLEGDHPDIPDDFIPPVQGTSPHWGIEGVTLAIGGCGGVSPSQQQRAAGSPDHDSQIWLNGEFVSCAEYGKIQAKKDQQETDRIYAIVQPILSEVQRAIFTNYGSVFGCNEKSTLSTCGKIKAKIMCSSDNSHPAYYKHERCNDPLCPKCYPKFAHRIADAVVNRVQGYRSVFGYDPIYHLVFWPDTLSGYTNLTDAFRNASVLLKKMGAKMAVVWYHPYRIPDEIKEKLRRYKHANNLKPDTGFWQMAHEDVLGLGCLAAYVIPGPHFHAIASGFLMSTEEYKKLGIGGYKKVRYLNQVGDIEKTAHYISTHACRELKKSTVRYFGKISYSMLARDDGTETIENIVCEKCGKPVSEYHCTEIEGKIEVTGIKHHAVTKKVIIYKYWTRGDVPSLVKLTRQEMIWGSGGEPCHN
jgi:hypothetical protein